jgi:hypothetical protein
MVLVPEEAVGTCITHSSEDSDSGCVLTRLRCCNELSRQKGGRTSRTGIELERDNGTGGCDGRRSGRM